MKSYYEGAFEEYVQAAYACLPVICLNAVDIKSCGK